MRNVHFRVLAVCTLAVFVFATPSAAQPRSTVILNSLEVRQLIERSDRGDHERLSAHFAALAERYAGEARRHTSMAQGFVGNPSRALTTGLSTHCNRLAELNTQSGTTLRALAAHHDKLAGGQPSAAPREGARFEAGAGAPGPTDQELTTLAATARLAADHRRLEEYFLTVAKRYRAEATNHAALATSVRGNPRLPTGAAIAAHCDKLASQFRDAAKEATAAAARHKELAGTVQ